MILAEGIECSDERRRIDGTRRVVGRDQHDGAGGTVDQPFGGGRVGPEMGGCCARQRPWLDPQHLAALLMVPKPRHWQQHAIPGPRDGHQACEERLIAAGGDHDLIRHHADLGRIGLSQWQITVDGAVFGESRVCRPAGQAVQQARMRRVAWHRLTQIERRAIPPIIAPSPALRRHDRRLGHARQVAIQRRHVRRPGLGPCGRGPG